MPFDMPPARTALHRLHAAALVAGLTLLAPGAPALGQEAPPAPASFRLVHQESGSTLRLRGFIQADGRFFPDDAAGVNTTGFVLRRVRFRLDGTLFSDYEYRFQTELANNSVDVLDAFIQARIVDALQIRVGKGKAPVSLDRLQGPDQITFYERSYPTQLAPNRDIGIQALGEVAGGAVSYALGLFDGAPDGGSVTDNTDDALEWNARLFVHPLRGRVESLGDLGLGVALTHGEVTGSASAGGLSSFRTSGRATFFRYAGGAFAAGDRTRVDLQGYLYTGRLGLQAEWIRSTHEVSGGAQPTSIANEAWNANVSVALTDDRPTYGGIRPGRVLSRARGTLGALELAGRLQAVRFDDDAFAAGLADPTVSAREALAWTLGLNWYPHPNGRITLNFERTTFEGGAGLGDRLAENAILTRVQLVL